MLSDKGLDLIRSTTCKDPCRECAGKQVLLAEIDQLRADCNTLQASVALYFRENKQLEMDKLDVAKLKALLRRCKSPVFEAHYDELHEEILEVLDE